MGEARGHGVVGEAGGRGGPAVAALWFGFLAGPIAFLLELGTTFALVEWACEHGVMAALWVIKISAVALALAGVWRAHRNWREIGVDPEPVGEGAERSSPRSRGNAMAHRFRTDAPGAEGRSRFLALGGMATGAFFLLVLLASALPAGMISPCQ